MNSVNIIGRLLKRDEEDSSIRYLAVDKPYYSVQENKISDIVPLQNWKHDEHGDLFNLEEGALVGIKGRIENYGNKVVIVIESIMYLGSK